VSLFPEMAEVAAKPAKVNPEPERVWCVAKHTDSVKHRLVKEIAKQARYGWEPEPQFPSEIEAVKFMVDRAETRVAAAYKQYELEMARAKKCAKKLAAIARPERTKGSIL